MYLYLLLLLVISIEVNNASPEANQQSDDDTNRLVDRGGESYFGIDKVYLVREDESIEERKGILVLTKFIW